MKIAQRLIDIALVAGLAASCSTARSEQNIVSRGDPICESGAHLGRTSVTLRTDWRADQKDPEEREALALQAIENAMGSVPCISSVEFVTERQSVSDTHVEFTLREFGPEFILSVPVIWTSRTHVAASISVTDAATGQVLFRASEQRKHGGAFAIRPLSAVGETFEEMISDWFIGGRIG